MGEPRIRSRRAAVVCVAVLSVVPVAGALGSQTQARRPSKPQRAPAVLSPRSGQRLAAKPVLIRVYLGSAQLVGARLNGRPIGTDLWFGPVSRVVQCANLSVQFTRGKTCQLQASPSHGLRYGVNVLRVRFKLGRSALVRTVRFRVAGDRPLAAAGRDRLIEPGARSRLNGRASLMPPGLAWRLLRAGKRARLRYQWRLVQAPSTGGWMLGANTATPWLVSRSAGTYKVRLTVTSPDGRTGTDVLILRSTNPGEESTTDAAPLVGVKTMVYRDGKWGVELNTYRDIPVPGCGYPGTNSVRFTAPVLGESCFYADPGQARDWVQLVVLDRSDLSLVQNGNRAFDCPAATDLPQEHNFDFSGGGPNPYSQNQQQCITGLVGYLNGLAQPGNDLVIAVNQPGDGSYEQEQEQPPVGVGTVLSGRLIAPNGVLANGHNLGIGDAGARWWLTPPNNGQGLPNAVRGTFSAIGVPGFPTGGASNMPADPGSWDPAGAGRLDTYVQINNNARYAPLSPSPEDIAESPLIKVLTQQPTPWPTTTTDQSGAPCNLQPAALSAIGNKAGLTSDPRTYYYTAPSTENWAADQLAVSNLQYTDFGASPGFSLEDFACAKKELYTELFWITKVDTYTGALAAPYDGASKTLWSDFQKSVSDIVNSETSNATGAKVFAGAKEVVGALLDLIPGAGAAFGEAWKEGPKLLAEVVATTYRTGLGLAELGGEPADSEFGVATADLGKELADRLDAAETEISVRFRNIIVADYGKLKTVALCSTGNPDCPDQQDGWQLTQNSITHMETLVKLGLQRDLFTTLLPVKYPLALGLQPVSRAHQDEASADAAKFCGPPTKIPPFEHTTGVYLWPVVDPDYWAGTLDGPPQSDWAYTPIVLTTGDPGSFGTWKAANWTVFGRMFDPLSSSGSFDKGGLGIDEQQFMSDNYGLNGSSYNIGDRFQPFICGGKGWNFG